MKTPNEIAAVSMREEAGTAALMSDEDKDCTVDEGESEEPATPAAFVMTGTSKIAESSFMGPDAQVLCSQPAK